MLIRCVHAESGLLPFEALCREEIEVSLPDDSTDCEMVYLLRGCDGAVLFVGRTRNLTRRLRRHRDRHRLLLAERMQRGGTLTVSVQAGGASVAAALVRRHSPVLNVRTRPKGRLKPLELVLAVALNDPAWWRSILVRGGGEDGDEREAEGQRQVDQA